MPTSTWFSQYLQDILLKNNPIEKSKNKKAIDDHYIVCTSSSQMGLKTESRKRKVWNLCKFYYCMCCIQRTFFTPYLCFKRQEQSQYKAISQCVCKIRITVFHRSSFSMTSRDFHSFWKSSRRNNSTLPNSKKAVILQLHWTTSQHKSGEQPASSVHPHSSPVFYRCGVLCSPTNPQKSPCILQQLLKPILGVVQLNLQVLLGLHLRRQ